MIVSKSEFRGLVNRLKEFCPPAFPVDARLVSNLRDCYGYCELLKVPKSKFRIRVYNQLSDVAAKHILYHEWAHALSWTMENQRYLDHSPEWGLAMSRIWQELEEL